MTPARRETFHDFAFDLLDSFDAHIAVLDSGGSIVAVNDAWRRFAHDNGGDGALVGASYLAVCESAAGAGDPHAAEMLAGLRELLAGGRSRFSAEYPCDSPSRQRWFRASVTRFVHRGAMFVAVVHEDITERRRIERELVCANCSVEAMNRELQEVLARERLKARTDDLTGLDNRRQFFESARQMVAAARRQGKPLSIIMLDIDHFKRVNDARGHQAGDVILQQVAGIARAATRASDVLARYGGEEFVVALPGDAAEALAVSEKIRERVAAELDVTISGGVSQLAGDPDTLEALIGRADQALYAAKNTGRNRSCVVPTPQAAG